MKMLLLAPEFDFSEEWHSAIKYNLPDDELLNEDQVDNDEAEIALVYNPPPNVLNKYPNLRAIISMSAGVDCVLDDDNLPNIPIIRLATTDMMFQMREYVLYQVLRLHRNFALAEKQQTEKEWKWMPNSLPSHLRRISVLGLGRLGLHCAIALSQLGFKVSGWSKSFKDIPNVTCLTGEEGLSNVVKNADILICMLPLYKSTLNILSEPLFNQLPSGAWLINVSRGGCLNEVDLLSQIAIGKIEHATLDVFKTEPLPPEHPFWNHPKITITPHMASDARPDSTAIEIADTVTRIREGRPLINTISRTKGY